MAPFQTSPDWETDGASWPHRHTSRFIQTPDDRWHVQRFGDGPTALLIHGTGAAGHSWANLAPFLREHLSLTILDLPGHGFTRSGAWPPPTLPGVSGRIGALLRKTDLKPDIVISHSAGAAIMLRMVHDGLIQPKLCISINGALSPFRGPAGFLFPLMAKALYYNPITAFTFAQGARKRQRVERLITQTGSRPPSSNIDWYAALMRRSGHVSGALGLMAHWDLSGVENILSSMTVPCLFIVGEKDTAVPKSVSEQSARLVDDGSISFAPDYGHLVHEEAPAWTADVILEFARRYALL